MKFEYIKFEENRSYEDAVEIYDQRIRDADWIYQKYQNFFTERPCPCCGKNNEKIPIDDFHNTYHVKKCGYCGTQFVDPCPNQEALNDYYANGKCNELLEQIYHKRAKKKNSVLVDDKVELLASLIQNYPQKTINILELGCSNGGFLSRLRLRLEALVEGKDIRMIGVDVSEAAIHSSCDKQLELYCDTAEHFLETTDITFDFVYHTELVEHILDPFAVFTAIRRKMKDGGFMIFTTPNEFSFEMRVLDYNSLRLLACNIFPPMHINSFGLHNIVHFLIRCGFGMVDLKTPGKLDIGILEKQIPDTNNKLVEKLANLDDDLKGYIQSLLSFTGSSSNMLCVAKKLEE